MNSGPPPSANRGGRIARFLAAAGVVAFLALLAFGLLSEGADPTIDSDLAEGEAPLAPDFELDVLVTGAVPPRLAREIEPALADGRLSLAELRGTPFVLNFWASWCIPCREEAPILARGWREHGAHGVLYLGLNMQDLTGDALDFVDEFEVDYPNVREPDNATAQAYGANGIPETYFVSARGRVVGHVVGVVTPDQLDAGVRGAKAGEVIGSSSGGAQRPQR